MRQLVIIKSITPRDNKSLDKYFNEINKFELISINDEVTLARRIKDGDQDALERLTNANLRFVVSVAKQYQNQGLSLGDLISEGNIGLMIAARRYDEQKGFKFISYAVWWIRQSIILAIAEHARTIRLPTNQLAMLSKLYKAVSKLEQTYARKPSAEELAEYLELPLEKVVELQNKPDKNLSIDESIRNDEDYPLLNVLHNNEPGPDQGLIYESVIKELHYSLGVLNKRDRELLIMFFGLQSVSPLTLEEIGKRFNITKEHVGRLKEKALNKLRNCSNASLLRSCLG
jgi:RNA polymerase primary sigma factor